MCAHESHDIDTRSTVTPPIEYTRSIRVIARARHHGTSLFVAISPPAAHGEPAKEAAGGTPGRPAHRYPPAHNLASMSEPELVELKEQEYKDARDEGGLRPLPRAHAHARPELHLRGRPDPDEPDGVGVLPREQRAPGARPGRRAGDPGARITSRSWITSSSAWRCGARSTSWPSRSCSSRRCSRSTRTAASSRSGAASPTRRRSPPRSRCSTAATRWPCTPRAGAPAPASSPKKPRRGIGRLALLSGAPVVPVAIVGSSHVRNWKRLQFPKITRVLRRAVRLRTRRGADARPGAGRRRRHLRRGARALRQRPPTPARPPEPPPRARLAGHEQGEQRARRPARRRRPTRRSSCRR